MTATPGAVPPHWLALEGRVCAVTGAASGIGEATARALAAAGARVALLDRNVQGSEIVVAELRARGANAMAVACDTASACVMSWAPATA